METTKRKRIVDLKDLAAELGISARTLSVVYRKLGWPCIRLGPKIVRFDLDRVLAFIASKATPSSESKPTESSRTPAPDAETSKSESRPCKT